MLTHLFARIRVVCLLAGFCVPAGAQTVTVPDDYPTIGDAVEFGMTLDPGEIYIILVRPGIYRESVVVRRGNIFIGALGGETVLLGTGRDTLRFVEAAHFQVSGLTITSNGHGNGVVVDRCSSGGVACLVIGNRIGVLVRRSRSCTFPGASLMDNTRSGLRVQDSSGISMHVTSIENNGRYGVELVRASNITFSKSAFHRNGRANLRAVHCEDVSLSSISFNEGGGEGVLMRNVNRALLSACQVQGNAGNGLSLFRSRDSVVTGTHFTDNGGWGVLHTKGVGDDFATNDAGSITPLPGDNTFSGNGLGPFLEN